MAGPYVVVAGSTFRFGTTEATTSTRATQRGYSRTEPKPPNGLTTPATFAPTKPAAHGNGSAGATRRPTPAGTPRSANGTTTTYNGSCTQRPPGTVPVVWKRVSRAAGVMRK